MGLVRYLLLLMIVAGAATQSYAQEEQKASRARRVEPGLQVATSDSITLRPTAPISVSTKIIEIPLKRGPEPLLGIHYLVAYPAEAVKNKIEGVVRFTATVRSGNVVDLRIDRSTHEILSKAVLESARLLEFDLSWHAPDKPEFFYSREVSFTLPDNITARP